MRCKTLDLLDKLIKTLPKEMPKKDLLISHNVVSLGYLYEYEGITLLYNPKMIKGRVFISNR